MNADLLLPFITYSWLVSITPGPNNITSTSAGMTLGYRRSLFYLLGVATGVTIIFALSGFFTSFIVNLDKSVMIALKWVGVTYILWLGTMPFLSINKSKGKRKNISYNFITGLSLQVVNPKLIINGAIVYSSFGKLIAVSNITVATSALYLGAVCFVCISIWTAVGSSLSKFFNNKGFYIGFNIFLAIMLGYVAWEIAVS
jgi:cysteine/O-acetylserine efflux protein